MKLIVAKDGTGDYTTLQAAVDAAPENGPAVILVKKGVYRERVIVNRDHLRILGEDREETVVTWSAYALEKDPDGTTRDTFLSFTFLVTGRDVTVENITIRNDAGDGRAVGQAVAVYAAGDRGRWLGCRMIAHQDTLFCGPVMPKVLRDIAPRTSRAECVPAVNEPLHTEGRQYFADCYIEGDVDYIFGSYRCWFEGCTLFMGERGGWYTAANTPMDQPFGFVFNRCRLTGCCPEGAGYLGRPWRKYARTLFLRCDMDACVAPLGFIDWDETRVVTELCGEYGTTGLRADQSARHPKQKRLTARDAAHVTVAAVLGGADHWQPEEETEAIR